MSIVYYSRAVDRGAPGKGSFGFAGNFTTPLAGPVLIASPPFDPSVFTPGSPNVHLVVKFAATLYVAVAGMIASLELFNQTDGVTVTTLSTPVSALVPTDLSSAPLVLPNARKLYRYLLRKTGGGTADVVGCTYAALEVSYSS